MDQNDKTNQKHHDESTINQEHDELERKKVKLMEELEIFNSERDRIRHLIGEIGGTKYSKRDNIINFIFLGVIITLFFLEQTTHFLPPMISLEVSVLLVSIKIVWMIHSQHKYNHFVFWILNSIEFRVNELSSSVRNMVESRELTRGADS
ncbi:MAG: hypothetical protein HQ557_02090 [Bacteroidetes bacterium]|nr:hypothetical protein [Bacteroidota bacterium]